MLHFQVLFGLTEIGNEYSQIMFMIDDKES